MKSFIASVAERNALLYIEFVYLAASLVMALPLRADVIDRRHHRAGFLCD